MFQPFQPFSPALLQALVARGKHYFVRQQFLRVPPGLHKGAFLISHYSQQVTAEDHFSAIVHDRYRFFYCWNEPAHRERLLRAAGTPDPYLVFSSLFRADWESCIPEHFRDNLRRYLQQLGWQPRRDEGVQTNYEIQFGELFIRIRLEEKEIQVKLEDVERCGGRL